MTDSDSNLLFPVDGLSGSDSVKRLLSASAPFIFFSRESCVRKLLGATQIIGDIYCILCLGSVLKK